MAHAMAHVGPMPINRHECTVMGPASSVLKGAIGVIIALARNSVCRLQNGPIFMEIGPGAGEIFTSQTAQPHFIEED